MDWITTFYALKNVYIDESFSNMAINEALEQHPGCSTGFVRMFTKGVIRDTIRLDHYIDQLADKGVKGIKNRTLIVLRMGIYAIESLDSVPEHAACNEAVKLARKVSKGSDKFVNAILRNFIRRRNELEKAGTFPAELEQLIRNQYGDKAEALLKALDEPASLVLRANLLKITREELISRLSAKGINAQPAPDSDIAIICEGGNVIGTDEFREGLFSVQSLSSIEAIEAFAPKEGAMVLDMCAAPGGKTTAMAEMMGNNGEIIACDVYDHRLELINAQAKRLGISCIKTELLDGTEFKSEFENSFDYVLADVPCSGLGVIQAKPEIKLRTDVSKFNELSDIQYKILKNAIAYTRSGGYVEYSTCTINKDENEAVVNRVLEDINMHLEKGGKSASVIENKQVLPYNNKVGFYYCILKID